MHQTLQQKLERFWVKVEDTVALVVCGGGDIGTHYSPLV